MSEDFNGWSPMNDDFQSISFNSYASGQTAAHLPHNLVSAFGSESCETGRPPKLYIDGFPLDLTEDGLQNFLRRIGCKVLSLKILNSRSRCGHRFSFVDFESTKEAQKAIELIRGQNLFKLSVSFSSTEKDRQKREVVIEREKQNFERLISKQFEMKEKMDNCSAIEASNANINGDTSSLSPIQSESGSHESSHLDLLSPFAKSDKLLKVLERSDDDCSFCSQGHPVEHLHFILNEQQVVDPTQMPALTDVLNICQTCGRKAGDLKLCSQCRAVTYCDRNCQFSHWPRHRLNCRQESSEFLNALNSTLNSSKSLNGNSSEVQRTAEPIKTVSKPTKRSASEEVVAKPLKSTKTTQFVDTVRATPKEITSIGSDSRKSGDNSKVSAIPEELEFPKRNESIPSKEVIKTAASGEIPVKERPKPDNNKTTPIKLTVDTEVLNDGEQGVVLCFGRSPFDFYLQKESAAGNMDIFADEIYKKMNDFPQLSGDELKKGALCGGIYSADGSCYRARIDDKINDNTYALYFIDYGNTEPVEKKDIKRLPEVFFSCKAQAMHCSLDRIVPKGNVWSKEAIALFGDIGETNEYSKVKIFEKTNEGIYKIDLINGKGESVRNKFVDKNLATFADELSESAPKLVKTPIPSPERALTTPVMSDSPVIVQSSPKVTFNMSSINDIPKYVPPMPSLEEKSEMPLKCYIETLANNSDISFMVTNIFNSDEFQYFGTIFTDEVKEVIEGLAEEYPGKPTVVPKVDDIVVVQGSDDECYRSYVLKVDQKSVKVFMFDSGFVEDVPKDKIFKLDDKFQKMPVFGAMFLPNTKTGARFVELSQTSDSTIDGIFIKKEGKMFFKKDDILIQLLDFKSTVALIKKSVEEEVENEGQPSKGDPFDELAVRQLPFKKSMEAFALYQDQNDYKLFYVAGDAEVCAELMKLCTQYSTKFDNNISVNPLPRNVYLVRSSGDGEWYRAVVYSVNKDKVKVKYIDFGNEEEIDIDYVMELSGELSLKTIPPLAIKCKVAKTKLSDDELKTKIQNATDGAYLLKMEVLQIENGFHLVKVK